MTRSIIIDASVVAKWLLPDEQDNISDRIKNNLTDQTIKVIVPIFIFYEINNLLKSATLSKRLNPKQAINAYKGFLDLNFSIYSSKELFKLTLEKAFELDISSYDASYVALAEHLEIPLFTADIKLVRKAESKLVLDLKSYPVL